MKSLRDIEFFDNSLTKTTIGKEFDKSIDEWVWELSYIHDRKVRQMEDKKQEVETLGRDLAMLEADSTLQKKWKLTDDRLEWTKKRHANNVAQLALYTMEANSIKKVLDTAKSLKEEA